MADLTLAALLRRAMREQRLNQTQLAIKAGVSQSLISNILSGTPREYRLDTLRRLAGALEISMNDVVLACEVTAKTGADVGIAQEVKDLPELLLGQDPEVQKQVVDYVRRIVGWPAT